MRGDAERAQEVSETFLRSKMLDSLDFFDERKNAKE
jgi:hypothetical protein